MDTTSEQLEQIARKIRSATATEQEEAVFFASLAESLQEIRRDIETRVNE